jgi:hypothetical protein
MKQFVIEHLTREASQVDGLRARAPHAHDADLHIETKSGHTVAIYVINRALRLPEIREKYEKNSALRLHTLFIVDRRILPAHQTEASVAYWMAALHALSDGRIYAYECDRRACTITPLHIAWRWGDAPRRFEYGPSVHIGKLRADVVDCSSKYITGSFAVADFGEEPFWKKRSPLDEASSKAYSWRNFSFNSSRRRSQVPPDDDEGWDAWEAFSRSYGDNSEYYTDEDWSNQTNRRSRDRGGQRQAIVIATHYATLGVALGAPFDVVKRAYRRMARAYHPDLHPTEKREYTEKMAEINAAFDAIRKHLDSDS